MIRRSGFFLAICSQICAIAAGANGQPPPVHITPLPQILNTNSLIDQPEEFRALQEQVERELSTSIGGLRLPVLHQRMAEIRDSLIKPFDGIKVSIINPSKLSINIFPSSVTFDLSKTPDEVLKDIRSEFKKLIKPPITTVVNSFDPKTRVLLTALLRALEKKGSLVDGIPGAINIEDIVEVLNSDQKTNTSILANLLAEKISAELESLLRGRLEELVDGISSGSSSTAFTNMKWSEFTYAVTGGLSSSEATGHEWMVNFLNDKLNEARQALARLLDAGEHEISKVISGANKFLTDASLGVNINPGKNGAVGTFGVTWRPWKCFQIGGVVGGLVGSSSEDSSNVLFACQTRASGDKFEVAVIGSKYLDADAWEFGAGVSLRTGGLFGSGDLGLTLSGYCLFGSEAHVSQVEDRFLEYSVITIAASMRLIELSAAAVTIGIICNDGLNSEKVFIQTSLPVYPKF